ncbi:MAG: hypothetical protein JNL30_16660 [Rubrivivax sp.]|nr:hypothetical protein [Rubrivivax sp.]
MNATPLHGEPHRSSPDARPRGACLTEGLTEGAPRARWAAQAGWAICALFAVCAVLAGCGPGLGGTGTGAEQDALAAYAAREVPVCEAEFADLLGCARPSAGAAPLPAADARFFAEATPASRTLLALDGQQAELRLRCAGVVFIGSFGQVGLQVPRYYGTAIEGGSRVRLASLAVRRTGGGVEVTLVDSLGLTLAGPQGLQPVSGTTAEAPCP